MRIQRIPGGNNDPRRGKLGILPHKTLKIETVISAIDADRQKEASTPLEHGFLIVSDQTTGRNSSTFNNDYITQITDVQTAQRPVQPLLAIDLQDFQANSGINLDSVINLNDFILGVEKRDEHQNSIIRSKLKDLPSVLKEQGKGILLLGNTNDYSLDEIYQLGNFTNSIPKGMFIVIGKKVTNLDKPFFQAWTTIITGTDNVHSFACCDIGLLIKTITKKTSFENYVAKEKAEAEAKAKEQKFARSIELQQRWLFGGRVHTAPGTESEESRRSKFRSTDDEVRRQAAILEAREWAAQILDAPAIS